MIDREILNDEVGKINHGWNLFMFQVMMLNDKDFKKEAINYYDKKIAKSLFKQKKTDELQ